VINKRRHKRVPLTASATIRYNFEESTKPIQAIVYCSFRDGVYLDKPIREDTVLSIEITFISTEGLMTTASIEGESVYVREMGGMYFMGIEFDEEINPIKRSYLHQHLQKILS